MTDALSPTQHLCKIYCIEAPFAIEVELNKAHVTIASAFAASEQHPHSHFVEQPPLLPASNLCCQTVCCHQSWSWLTCILLIPCSWACKVGWHKQNALQTSVSESFALVNMAAWLLTITWFRTHAAKKWTVPSNGRAVPELFTALPQSIRYITPVSLSTSMCQVSHLCWYSHGYEPPANWCHNTHVEADIVSVSHTCCWIVTPFTATNQPQGVLSPTCKVCAKAGSV